MRQDTAHQLATRLRILFDTGPRVYTCQQSQFLADWQHQQHIRFSTLRWAASGKGKVKEASGGRGTRGRVGTEAIKGGARPMVRTRMLTRLIDGLGRAMWSLTMPTTRSRTTSF